MECSCGGEVCRQTGGRGWRRGLWLGVRDPILPHSRGSQFLVAEIYHDGRVDRCEELAGTN